MARKAVKDLVIGDRVPLREPDGIAVISRKEKSPLFHAPGGCWRLDFKVVDGPHKGETIKDQHHPGEDEVEIVESRARQEKQAASG
jgi:hypothetical protein